MQVTFNMTSINVKGIQTHPHKKQSPENIYSYQTYSKNVWQLGKNDNFSAQHNKDAIIYRFYDYIRLVSG